MLGVKEEEEEDSMKWLYRKKRKYDYALPYNSLHNG